MSLPGAQEDGTLNSSTSSYRDLNGATAYCSTTFPSLYFHKDISSPKSCAKADTVSAGDGSMKLGTISNSESASHSASMASSDSPG